MSDRPKCQCGKLCRNKGRLKSGAIKWDKWCHSCQKERPKFVGPPRPLAIDMPRPICKTCGRNPCQPNGFRAYADGRRGRVWKTVCSACYERKRKGLLGPARPMSELRAFNYRSVKGNSCEECGFVARHPCQLDVYPRS